MKSDEYSFQLKIRLILTLEDRSQQGQDEEYFKIVITCRMIDREALKSG
jgi:hypothetical protein